MRAFDLHIHSSFSEGKSTIYEIANHAKILGFSGICISNYFYELKEIHKLKDEIARVSREVGIEIYLGFEAKNTVELNRLRNIRREYDILMVRGGKLGLNRKAVETKEVDILTHPEYERKDSGLNHTMAKLAAKNDVAIEVNFREILINSKATRSRIMHNIAQNIRLCNKYKAPIILTSGSISHWELKDPWVIMSMANILGLELAEAKRAISEIPEKIITNVKEKQEKKWIMPGVKIFKEST